MSRSRPSKPPGRPVSLRGDPAEIRGSPVIGAQAGGHDTQMFRLVDYLTGYRFSGSRRNWCMEQTSLLRCLRGEEWL